MDKIERLKKATKNVNKKLTEGLSKLPYFNSTNLNKNAITFRRYLINGEKIVTNGQLALYSSKLNTLIIDESILEENISDEQLEILILHECVHMASTDLEKQVIGFESEAMPITYNEALTQWLTLKLYYGKKNIKEAIQKNELYSESVIRINSLIEKNGEAIIYNGFFEADIQKNLKQFPKETKPDLIDEILFFGNSNEEKNAKISMKKLEKNIFSISNKKEQKLNIQQEPDARG